jgi:hypothetical protein
MCCVKGLLIFIVGAKFAPQVIENYFAGTTNDIFTKNEGQMLK